MVVFHKNRKSFKKILRCVIIFVQTLFYCEGAMCMFSMTKKYQGTPTYTWKAVGTPKKTSPKQLQKTIDQTYDKLLDAVQEGADRDYSNAFKQWLELLNNAMLLSKDEKLDGLDLDNTSGLKKEDISKAKQDVKRINKTKNIAIPQKVSDVAVSAQSLIDVSLIIAKYLDVLIDGGLVNEKDDRTLLKSYTSCCRDGLDVMSCHLEYRLRASVNRTDLKVINSCMTDYDSEVYNATVGEIEY